MTRLQVAIYTEPGGQLLADHSPLARNLRFSTGEHGFKSCSYETDMPLHEAFRLYDRPGLPHLEINGIGRAWEGRLEDPLIREDGLDVTALGYWRACGDAPVTALWSTTKVGEWEPTNEGQIGNHRPGRWEIDTNNRLYLAPKKGETFRNSDDVGSLHYLTPSGSSRMIVAASFSYEVMLPLNWKVQLYGHTQNFGSLALLWDHTASGAVQTGTVNITFSGHEGMLFGAFNNTGASATLTTDTGVSYVKITNLRVKTTTSASVYADEIARDLVAAISALNPTQLSSTTALIQSPGLDLRDELYEDEYPAGILTRLARLGDNQTPPRQWEVGVWEDRRLHVRPRGANGRTWYVDVGSVRIERTLDQLRNSAYAVYQDASNRTLRSTASTNAASVARYGLTRRAPVTASTTSATQATTHRDALLEDREDPQPRARFVVDEVFDSMGARYPLWLVRSGDTIVARNLPPNLSTEIDRIRRFRVSETEYNANNDRLSVTPESPLPSLEMLVARRQERI